MASSSSGPTSCRIQYAVYTTNHGSCATKVLCGCATPFSALQACEEYALAICANTHGEGAPTTIHDSVPSSAAEGSVVLYRHPSDPDMSLYGGDQEESIVEARAGPEGAFRTLRWTAFQPIVPSVDEYLDEVTDVDRALAADAVPPPLSAAADPGSVL